MRTNLTVIVALLSPVLLAACGQEVKFIEIDPTKIDFTKTTQVEVVEIKAMDIRSAVVPDVPFTFRSEDTAVATVDSEGKIKPAGDGDTAIYLDFRAGVTFRFL